MKQKVNKQWLVTLRNELHESIYDEVTGTEHKALRVLREPNQSKKQPAPKLIVVVKTVEQAQALKEKCFSLIASTNESIKRELKDGAFLHYEIKYSINIINSESDILLSVRDAQRRKKMDGEKIKSKLQISYDDLIEKQKMEHEYFNAETDKYKSDIKNIEDCINTLVDDTDYIFAESTGNSYRITYFDGECRQQISAGNLLIVVSSSDIHILDAPSRKKRSDKKYCLYYLKTSYDTICIYLA
jgi:cell division septum initiation protein DivIVA